MCPHPAEEFWAEPFPSMRSDGVLCTPIDHFLDSSSPCREVAINTYVSTAQLLMFLGFLHRRALLEIGHTPVDYELAAGADMALSYYNPNHLR